MICPRDDQESYKKRKRATARPSNPKPNVRSKPTTSEAKAPMVSAPPLRPRRLQIGVYWKEFWAYAGPTLSLIGASFLLSPQIEIAPSINLDPAQPLATQFLVSNRGHIPVNRVSFDCCIAIGGGHIGQLFITSRIIEPVATLHAGDSATRACAVESADIQTSRISITVNYDWPIIGKRDSKTAYFSLRKGASSYFLVPDAA